ncbi:MAG TPA: tetratricopeptide repeat protein [Candidatus Dormibacteraeota bacterium]|nr:tetratricopeptide repeat protein [Candidatus Dormibacteraeota bacterium]
MAGKVTDQKGSNEGETKAPAVGLGWLRAPATLSIVLALLTVAIFSPVAGHEFVNYDDPDYVTSNSHVVTGLTWENVKWAFTTGHASNWHPITWLSHMLDCQLFGQSAAAHHLINVLYHAADAVLLFIVMRKLTGTLWRSFLVGALLSLHPTHVESVAWISERKDVLSALFFLLTLMAYSQWVENGRPLTPALSPWDGERGPEVRSGSKWYWFALGFFALGLMSKPMLVTLPFVLLLLDVWPLERMKRGDLVPNRFLSGSFPRLLLEKVPFFVLSIASSVVTFLVQRKGGAVSTSISLPGRIENAIVSYAKYVADFLFPHDLAVLYPHPGNWPWWEIGLSAGTLVVLTLAIFWLGRTRPYLPVGWLWFLGMLVPAIGLVQVGVQSMADRYTYLPYIGLSIIVAWGLGELFACIKILDPDAREKPAVIPVGATVGMIACAVLTSKQISYWQNSETLFRRTVEVTKGNYLAHNNLGFYLSAKGKTQDAMAEYRKALEINPLYEDALNNMGYALAGQKKYQEAIGFYEAALRIRPKHTEVHNNLGNALADIGQVDEAIKHYRIVLEQNPEHADAHNNLGIALAMKGQFDEAVGHFHAAMRLKPKDASAHSNLGNAFAVQHKLDEAIAEYKESLRLNPKDAQAHNNLGNALTELGRLDEATQQYEKALRLNPDNPEAHYNLGLVFTRRGDRPHATEHFQEALKLRPDYADARNQLRQLGEQKP